MSSLLAKCQQPDAQGRIQSVTRKMPVGVLSGLRSIG